jgi:methyl-accepting chemotaxis protein
LMIFAVVAEEVRNLAMRSAEAAKNTNALIEQSVGNAKNGVSIADEVGKSLAEIVESNTQVNGLITEIAAASKEQATGVEQVNQSVSQMDKVTQTNAANAEESAAASEELSAQAEQLRNCVGELLKLVGAASAPQRVATKDPSTPTRPSSAAKPARKPVQTTGGTSKRQAAPSPTRAAKSKAESVIPFDDDAAAPSSSGDFSEFNKAA